MVQNSAMFFNDHMGSHNISTESVAVTAVAGTIFSHTQNFVPVQSDSNALRSVRRCHLKEFVVHWELINFATR